MVGWRLSKPLRPIGPAPILEKRGIVRSLGTLVNLGVDGATSPPMVRRIRTINVVAVTSIGLTFGFSAFYAVLDFDALWPVIIANLAWVAGYSLGIWTNAQGHHRRAVWILLASGWGNTMIPGAALGASTGVYLFMILVPMLGVLISPPGDRVMQAVVIGLGAAAFAAIPLWFPNPPDRVVGSSSQTALFISSAVVVSAFGSLVVLYYRNLVDVAEEALGEANRRTERLLLNILPAPIAERLKSDESPIADRAEDVTVLFADLVDSTHLSERLSADELVAFLNRVFTCFDDVCEEYGLEKITTIGDAYLAVSGLPTPREDHVEAAARAALAMRQALRGLEPEGFGEVGMRFGLHSGPVVAGVIGKMKFKYDLWGDTVNVAARMQTHGEPCTIHVTARVREVLKDRYVLQPRGTIAVKGKGSMDTYFLLGPIREAATLPR